MFLRSSELGARSQKPLALAAENEKFGVIPRNTRNQKVLPTFQHL